MHGTSLLRMRVDWKNCAPLVLCIHVFVRFTDILIHVIAPNKYSAIAQHFTLVRLPKTKDVVHYNSVSIDLNAFCLFRSLSFSFWSVLLIFVKLVILYCINYTYT